MRNGVSQDWAMVAVIGEPIQSKRGSNIGVKRKSLPRR